MPNWDDLTRQRGLNIQTISELVKAGSDSNLPHNCEHMFLSETRAPIEALEKLVLESSYQLSEIYPGHTEERGEYFWLVVVSEVPLDPRFVLYDCIRMMEWGEQCGVSYDGWGADVVSAKHAT